MAYDRITRKIQNSKESSVASGDTKNVVSHFPSLNSMKEGEQVYSQEVNKPIALYKKHKGKLYKSYFSDNGNFIVDGNINIGRDSFTNGTVFGNQIYYYPHNFNHATSTKVYLEFNQSGATSSFHPYNTMIAPYNGRLLKVLVRTENAGGSTVIGIHKSSDGTTHPNSTAFETSTNNIASVDTTYEFNFTVDAFFDKGDILALSIDPTSAIQDTSIVSVWSYNIIMD